MNYSWATLPQIIVKKNKKRIEIYREKHLFSQKFYVFYGFFNLFGDRL